MRRGAVRLSDLRLINLLLTEYLRLVWIADARTDADVAKVYDATISELIVYLLLLLRQMRYKGGRIARQTVMACCVAGAGVHSKSTSRAGINSLGVRIDVLAEAQKRIQRVLRDAPSADAIASGDSQRSGGAGIRQSCPRGDHLNSPFRG